MCSLSRFWSHNKKWFTKCHAFWEDMNLVAIILQTKKMSEFLNALKNKTTIDATEQDFMKVEDNADAP